MCVGGGEGGVASHTHEQKASRLYGLVRLFPDVWAATVTAFMKVQRSYIVSVVMKNGLRYDAAAYELLR